MKTLIFLFFFIPLIHSQSDSSIYFENFESIEFEAKNDMKTLTFILNREKGLTKIVIIKQEIDTYVFSTITEDGMSEPLFIKKRTVKEMMPNLIKNYTTRYNVTTKKLNKIIDLIY